jgi:hypothetical protein
MKAAITSSARVSLLWKEACSRGLPARGCLLVVESASQRLTLWMNGTPRATYAVSTARKGLGTRAGSLRTPVGWHRVAARIGAGRRRGAVFVGRVFTGEVLPRACWRSPGGADRILTRILWLRGLEPGLNAGPGVDSHQRYIYIHGTNQEQRLGRPASHGCVRLGNDDMLALFRCVRQRTTWCWIG